MHFLRKKVNWIVYDTAILKEPLGFRQHKKKRMIESCNSSALCGNNLQI